MPSPTKRCPKCGVTKPRTNEFFSVDRYRSSGLSNNCRPCDAARAKYKTLLDFDIDVDVPEQVTVLPPHAVVDKKVSDRLVATTAKRYLVTSAQNATPVHGPFWETLLGAAKHLEAQILVVPLRYKNPTSQWTEKNIEYDWWAPELKDYLLDQRKALHEHLVLAADVRTQPTASSPLSGFESLTGPESCIIGHTKMQFKTVAVPSGAYPKILTTSGACTVPNFTDTKTGKIGAFHHYLGAVLVEIDDDLFHVRQINADREDGSFIDLDDIYYGEDVHEAGPAKLLALGDLHAWFTDTAVATTTVGEIIPTLNPGVVLVEDALDGYSGNPHHIGNPFISQAKYRGKLSNVRDEVDYTVRTLAILANGRKVVVAASNHDDFLMRWVQRHDWKQDPSNAAFYLETAKAILDSVKMTPGGAEYADPFRYWVDKLKGSADIRCLAPDESFTVADIECSMHGDRGPNGARGTLKNLSRLGVKVITGHSHSPGVEEGHYQVGTSTPLRLEYNKGPSSWLNTHCVVYANGKRALISIIKGRWRIPPERVEKGPASIP